MIRVSEADLAAIGAHGAREFPNECVGVLLGDVEGDLKTVRELRPLDNTFDPSWETEERRSRDVGGDESPAYGRERRYLVGPDAMFALMQEERRTKRKVLGFYHSHPDHPAQPSEFDREWASPWYTYLIVSILKGRPDALTAWQLNDDRASFVEEKIDILHL
jgi:proteasome lid subunit RPN8/RPN11